VELTDTDLRELIDGIWAPAVGLTVDWDEFVEPTWEHAARLRFCGGWHGHVHVDATEGFGRRLAVAMFGIEPDDASPEDARDALGELANVLAGNVKSYSEDPVDLDLPETGTPQALQATSAPTAAAQFTVEGHAVRVAVVLQA
jgi:chemotaxis protein CheX